MNTSIQNDHDKLHALAKKIEAKREHPRSILDIVATQLCIDKIVTSDKNDLKQIRRKITIAIHPDRAQNQDLKSARNAVLQIVNPAIDSLEKNSELFHTKERTKRSPQKTRTARNTNHFNDVALNIINTAFQNFNMHGGQQASDTLLNAAITNPDYVEQITEKIDAEQLILGSKLDNFLYKNAPDKYIANIGSYCLNQFNSYGSKKHANVLHHIVKEHPGYTEQITEKIDAEQLVLGSNLDNVLYKNAPDKYIANIGSYCLNQFKFYGLQKHANVLHHIAKEHPGYAEQITEKIDAEQLVLGSDLDNVLYKNAPDKYIQNIGVYCLNQFNSYGRKKHADVLRRIIKEHPGYQESIFERIEANQKDMFFNNGKQNTKEANTPLPSPPPSKKKVWDTVKGLFRRPPSL